MDEGVPKLPVCKPNVPKVSGVLAYPEIRNSLTYPKVKSYLSATPPNSTLKFAERKDYTRKY